MKRSLEMFVNEVLCSLANEKKKYKQKIISLDKLFYSDEHFQNQVERDIQLPG
jgi:hypothetical protein